MDGSEEMKIAFVIGNGHSRSVFDLSQLKDKGIIYGCNLLIEEMQLDNTVACDRHMVVHLIAQGFDKVTNLWTRQRWAKTVEGNIKPLPDPVEQPKVRYDQEIHWNSGVHAVNLAANQGSDVVVMIGFDLWPREDGFNNIYQSRSEFYSGKAIDPSHWIHQLGRCYDRYSDVSFVQIQPSSWKDPEDWLSRENYTRDDYSGLREWLKEL